MVPKHKNPGRKSWIKRASLASVASLALIAAAGFVGIGAANAADGGQTQSVNVTRDNVTISGTVSVSCDASSGSYDLTVTNNDVVDDNVVSHAVGFLVNGSPFESVSVSNSTPLPFTNTFNTNGPGTTTTAAIGIVEGEQYVTLWSYDFICDVTPPAPTAHITSFTATYDAAHQSVVLSGTADVENAPEGANVSVAFTVTGPDSPTAASSPVGGDGSFGSSFAVTQGDAAKSYSITAQVLINGAPVGDSACADVTVPAADNGGGNNGGGDNGGNTGGGDNGNGNGGNTGGSTGGNTGGSTGGSSTGGNTGGGSTNTGTDTNTNTNTGTDTSQRPAGGTDFIDGANVSAASAAQSQSGASLGLGVTLLVLVLVAAGAWVARRRIAAVRAK